MDDDKTTPAMPAVAPLSELLEAQDGILTRRQLSALGFDADHVRNQISAGRWVQRTPRVISTVTGELTVAQRRWLAVLHAGPRSILGGLTAASRFGLAGWERDEITVLVDDELSFEAVDGVHFFRTRRPFTVLRSARPGIPSCELEPAILLYAGYDATIRSADGVLSAAVQQRLTTAARLEEWVEKLRPLRRSRVFHATLNDIAGGSHSGAELDLVTLCHTFDIPLPDRQTMRTDRGGNVRWTDAEWDLPDGRVLVLEIDGSFHLDVVSWGQDVRRSRRITTPTRVVIRCTAYELRHEPAEVALDLIGLGLPGRVPGDAA